MASVVARVEELFAARGDAAYFGEAISQTEHALQTAWLAEKSGASPALIVAALLHDIGHLLHALPENCAEQGIDDTHEELGARYLETCFGPAVSEPVRLHVAAKRYLCAVDPRYRATLSAASERSLQLQGGPMTSAEIASFETAAGAHDAVALRLWDDEAKINGLLTPPLGHFRRYLEEMLAGK